MLYKTLPCQTAPCPSVLLQGLLIWRCQVWEYQRPHSSLNYLTFHDDIPAWSGRSYPLQGSVKRENGPNKKYSLWWLMNRTGGLAFLWFTVVQVTTQLVGLVYLSAQPQNYLPDVFPQSITHNSKPDIWVSSYITHVLLIYACVSIMRDICRDNHRCADRAYVSWAQLLSGSVFRHHQFTTTCILTSRLIFIHLNPRIRFDNCIVLYKSNWTSLHWGYLVSP